METETTTTPSLLDVDNRLSQVEEKLKALTVYKDIHEKWINVSAAAHDLDSINRGFKEQQLQFERTAEVVKTIDSMFDALRESVRGKTNISDHKNLLASCQTMDKRIATLEKKGSSEVKRAITDLQVEVIVLKRKMDNMKRLDKEEFVKTLLRVGPQLDPDVAYQAIVAIIKSDDDENENKEVD